MEIVSLKAVIGSFPVFLMQRQRLPGSGEQSAAVQTESSGLSTVEQGCFIAVGQNVTAGEKVRDISDISLPLQPRMDTPGTFPLTEMSGGFMSTIEYSWTKDKLISNYL